jgi:hypothetical protein
MGIFVVEFREFFTENVVGRISISRAQFEANINSSAWAEFEKINFRNFKITGFENSGNIHPP